jgi:hypothetical protein
MINFMQSNQNIFKLNNSESDSTVNFNIIDDNVWESLTNKILEKNSLDKKYTDFKTKDELLLFYFLFYELDFYSFGFIYNLLQ